jgi:hypothetical protein
LAPFHSPGAAWQGTSDKEQRLFPMNAKAHEEKQGLQGHDKVQGDLTDVGDQDIPEGLKRERKGPLDKNTGRGKKNGRKQTSGRAP